jgi:hypothetical protein
MSIGANNGLFTGIHNGKLDEKNRVTIPAAWRFDAEATFLAMYHPALASVVVFPPSMAERIRVAASQVTVSDPVKMDALSLLGTNSIQVTCDKAGRITLNDHVPHLLADAAQGRPRIRVRAHHPPRLARAGPLTRIQKLLTLLTPYSQTAA